MGEIPSVNPVIASVGTILDADAIEGACVDRRLGIEAETETMQVPFTIVGLIVGRKGENLRHIHDIYNVTLRVRAVGAREA